MVTTNANNPNQLLIEMDGFDGNENIIVIAATNRTVMFLTQPSYVQDEFLTVKFLSVAQM